MNRAWTAASVIAVLLVAQAARARPDEPRFGEPAPEPRFSNGACVVLVAPDRAERVWQIDWLHPAEAVLDSARRMVGIGSPRAPGVPRGLSRRPRFGQRRSIMEAATTSG